MFNSIGWGEIVLLLLVGLFIFGPDRLPTMAKEAADGLKKVRGFVAGAKTQIRDEFGDEFADIDIRSLNPREFVRRQLLDDDPAPLIKRNGSTRVTPKAATARMADATPEPVALTKPAASAEPAPVPVAPVPVVTAPVATAPVPVGPAPAAPAAGSTASAVPASAAPPVAPAPRWDEIT